MYIAHSIFFIAQLNISLISIAKYNKYCFIQSTVELLDLIIHHSSVVLSFICLYIGTYNYKVKANYGQDFRNEILVNRQFFSIFEYS